MHVVMGATGHLGVACVEALVAQNRPVLALIRSPDKAASLEGRGIQTAIVDVRDPDSLRAAFRHGRRAFLLNPPAAPSTDTDAEETATVRTILAALEGSGLEKVVAASTMGAVAGEGLSPGTGDSSVLHGFEKGLAAQPIPAAINRAAYYYSNFDLQLDEVSDTGKLRSMLSIDFAMPMVDPIDLGKAAARRLISGLDDVGVISIEGPERYTIVDVARAFSNALGRTVEPVEIPRDGWIAAYRAQGFSTPAAEAYSRMTAAALDGPMTPRSETEKGEVKLQDYIARLVPS